MPAASIAQAIVLKRINYGEADRILTLLTRDQGKLAAIARGVRRERSKLAGGIELFSVSEVGIIKGRGEVTTLTTSRLLRHFDKIIGDIDRTMLGYSFIKAIDKTTEADTDATYFDLLEQAFSALDDLAIDSRLVQAWFYAQLLKVSGHTPNVTHDNQQSPLATDQTYHFDNQHMLFSPHPNGAFGANHIKLLRLALAANPPALARIQGQSAYIESVANLTKSMAMYHFHL